MLRRLKFASRFLPTRLVLASLAILPTLALSGSLVSACSSEDESVPRGDAGVDSSTTDICQTPEDAVKKVRIAPREIVVAPGEKRKVHVFIEPDVCVTTPIPIAVENGATAKVEGTFEAGLQSAEAWVDVVGVAVGKTKVTATFGPSVATLEVDVRAKTPVACAGDPATGNLAPGGALEAPFPARLALAAGAALDEASIDPLERASVVAPFDAQIACATDVTVPAEHTALGPAITFGPVEKHFLRELQFEIPVNPSLLPPTANLRHVRMLFKSNSLKERLVPVTNPRFEPRGAGWVMRFDAPRLGTYQAVVANNAGTVTKKRKLTHRAIFGFSMGGIGSSMFGMNHHDLFDIVVPLGGPMDSGHFLSYALKYHFGGFCERQAGDPIPTTPCHADVGQPTELYQHIQHYEDWWHQKGVDGTGGTFGRDSMVNIFRDVAAGWGNPAFANPEHAHVAMGINDPLPVEESVDAEYCKDPTPAKTTIAATGFYDRRFNPDGKLPVIKVCDGRSQAGFPGKWAPGGGKPLEMIVAVDLNANGIRDEGEPVIVQPWEPFEDVGKDGVASKDEAGYDPVANPDPAGDDYDPQYNPLGTEANNLYEEGEPYQDLGLDGVKCPTGETCKYDVGEGNGKFDIAVGLKTFYERDARLQLTKYAASKDPAGGPWTDEALWNVDYFSDGGIRDIFNWGTVGYHYMGGFVGRGRAAAYYNDWHTLPNVKLVNNNSDLFDPKEVDWSALPKSVYLRYGNIDATQRQIEKGDGQHVGYADQVFRRIQTGMYYIGSRWPDADKKYVEDPVEDDTKGPCVANLSCNYPFKSPTTGREGPMTVILPPGYHAPENKDTRYPVVYFLHGYGQTPEDLQALVILVKPFMGSGLSSRATRLAKMIMVIVDGRCRGEGPTSECARGTFYVDAVKKGGPQMDTYFQDLMKDVDVKYRTQGPSEVEVTE